MNLSDEEILKVIDPMMDTIMLGVSRRDYTLHSTNFSVNLKSTLSSEQFLTLCDKNETAWGLPGHRELLSIFRKEKSFTVLWKQLYTKTDEDVLAMTTVALKGGRYFVDFFLVH